MKHTKAYENLEFLGSESARPVRILCEYEEPRQRLARTGATQAIAFFGSARVKPHAQIPGATGRDIYGEAADLAEKLARWIVETRSGKQRLHLCTGGGDGLMRAVHEGAARVDRTLNIGLNISLPMEQTANDFVDADGAYEFHYFFMRKFWFVNLAEAFVVFPGGVGTLDEVFEVLTLTQTGKIKPRPILLYDAGFWSATVNFGELARRGFISPEDFSLFRVVDTVDEAYKVLTEALAGLRPAGPEALDTPLEPGQRPGG
jgi:uncharacterized protein (TIGR00730 family)